ncbi:MAG TPA: 1-deoxy-D-xylulose-5-phosphate synthase, partial [Lactobacillus crispatus]|nr:1-deoxy-D-xylulose-5-phosphate synthase [Lactobacillus crispatus]
ATLINPKYVAHLDTETLTSLMANHELVVTLEDNTLESGFGEKIASYYGPNNMKVRNYGEKKEYTDNESVESIYKRNHLLLNQIFNDIIKIIK